MKSIIEIPNGLGSVQNNDTAEALGSLSYGFEFVTQKGIPKNITTQHRKPPKNKGFGSVATEHGDRRVLHDGTPYRPTILPHTAK